MQTALKKSLFTALSLVLLTLPASAGNSQTLTQKAAGVSYQLTTPNPLPPGAQKLILKLMRGSQALTDAKLSALATMGDGMKTPVKITPKAKGEFELQTRFSMGGEWQLRLQLTAPVRSEVKFKLRVAGGEHSGHHM